MTAAWSPSDAHLRRGGQEPGEGLFVGGVTLPLALADLGLIGRVRVPRRARVGVVTARARRVGRGRRATTGPKPWSDSRARRDEITHVERDRDDVADALVTWLLEVDESAPITVWDGADALARAVSRVGLEADRRGSRRRACSSTLRPYVTILVVQRRGYAIRPVHAYQAAARVEVHRAAWKPSSIPYVDGRPVDPDAESSLTPAAYRVGAPYMALRRSLDLVAVAVADDDNNGQFAAVLTHRSIRQPACARSSRSCRARASPVAASPSRCAWRSQTSPQTAAAHSCTSNTSRSPATSVGEFRRTSPPGSNSCRGRRPTPGKAARRPTSVPDRVARLGLRLGVAGQQYEVTVWVVATVVLATRATGNGDDDERPLDPAGASPADALAGAASGTCAAPSPVQPDAPVHGRMGRHPLRLPIDADDRLCPQHGHTASPRHHRRCLVPRNGRLQPWRSDGTPVRRDFGTDISRWSVTRP